jgi:hypothetical protein
MEHIGTNPTEPRANLPEGRRIASVAREAKDLEALVGHALGELSIGPGKDRHPVPALAKSPG